LSRAQAPFSPALQRLWIPSCLSPPRQTTPRPCWTLWHWRCWLSRCDSGTLPACSLDVGITPLPHHVSCCVDVVECVFGAVQVTACSSLMCGPGVCTVGSVGPLCDCTDTGTTGLHCEAVEGRSPSPVASPTPPSAATAGASRSSPSRSPTPSPVPSPTPPPLLPCPGTVNVDAHCSGHGSCSRSVAGCTVFNLECVASCRWVAYVVRLRTHTGCTRCLLKRHNIITSKAKSLCIPLSCCNVLCVALTSVRAGACLGTVAGTAA
jgi:hypothetical protein